LLVVAGLLAFLLLGLLLLLLLLLFLLFGLELLLGLELFKLFFFLFGLGSCCFFLKLGGLLGCFACSFFVSLLS